MQPTNSQKNGAHNFLLFKCFLNDLLLIVFMQNTLSKLTEVTAKRNGELFFTKSGNKLLLSSHLDKSEKFEVDF